MHWILFIAFGCTVLFIVWHYRVCLRQALEGWITWARSKGEIPLTIVLLLLSSIPVVPQNVITLAWSTMRMRWGIPLSFVAMLLRVWVCCTIASPLITPVQLSVLRTWWEGYFVLQLSPMVGAAAVGLQLVGYSTSTILLLTIPVAAVNTLLLAVCPNGLWQVLLRRKLR